MDRVITIIKYGYLQHIRSYRFLITLCFTLAFAYSFIPAPDASYSTIRIGDYIGEYNSAWIANVSAIMTSVFLSLIGYYLINNGLKNDIDSKLGQIIATTRISNFKYLLSKALVNFFVLLTIVFVICMMSILLLFMYSNEASFAISDFVIAYLLIPIPSIFFISILAVVLEVILIKKSVIQNTLFFVSFTVMMGLNSTTAGLNSDDKQTFPTDFFGINTVIDEMNRQVKNISPTDASSSLTIGFVIKDQTDIKRFNFEGVSFSMTYVLMRLLVIIAAVGLIAAISPFFHRFNLKEVLRVQKSEDKVIEIDQVKEIDITLLPKPKSAFGILPFYKTELLMMVRKGKNWLWILNFGGMIALALVPLNIAHAIVLPILWFLQVSRWASLATKEKEYNVHYFAFSAFRPLQRLLSAQLLAGISIAVVLALPLMFRYAILLDYVGLMSILLGAIFIVVFSTCLGIISQGKRLFEILFFMITYANVNAVPVMDYFGGLSSNLTYLMIMAGIIMILAVLSYGVRKFELSRQ